MNEPQEKPLSFSEILLACGGLLIVVAVIVLASTGWQSFSPAARVLTASLPLIALYAIGFGSRGNPRHAALSRGTILTGSIIMPVVLGIIAYQSGLYEYVDANLVFGVSLVSLAWYAFLEFALGERWHAIGTIVASLSLVASFGSLADMASWGFCVAGVVLAYFYLSIGRHYSQERDNAGIAEAYGYVGAITGTAGLLLFPPSFVSWLSPAEWADAYVLTLYAAASVMFFAVAVSYSAEWQRNKSALDLALRQVAENCAAISLVGSAALVSLTSSETTTIILALVMGVTGVIIGSSVKIGLFRQLGLLASAVSLLKLIFFAATQVGAGWPIMLLIVGFVLIGLAYASQQEGARKLFSRLSSMPSDQDSLFGLGVNPEPKNSDADELIEGEDDGHTGEIAYRAEHARFVSSGAPAGGGATIWFIVFLFVLYLLGRLLPGNS